MTFLELAEKRYSCRKFSDRPVEKEKIDAILKAAQSAPTAVDKQPCKIFLAEGHKAEELRAAAKIRFVTPVIMVIGGKAEDAWVRDTDQRNFEDVDASIIASHIMMEIEEQGLGTVWVGHFDAPAVKEAYPQMKDYDLIALFPIGYPAEDAVPGPLHAKRKEIKELVEEL